MRANEAAAKYIMTAVFSSAVLMMGLSFVYGLSGGSLYYNDVAAAVANGEMSGMLIVALAFVLAGIGFKLSLVPFHLWTADVYQASHFGYELSFSHLQRFCRFCVFRDFCAGFRGGLS